MREATLIMAYYENPDMLREQYAHMRRFSKEVRKYLRCIVVDDGSPQNPAENVAPDAGMPVTVFRIEVDVRWNQDAARNIGAHHSETRWLLLTDMDHMIPEPTWQYLLTADLNEYAAYKFARVTAPNMVAYKPHPNSYFMTRDIWDRVGGYDERFAGYYGTDGDFRDRLNAAAPVVNLPHPIIRVPREHIHDASTTRYARKSPEDKRIREIKAERAAVPGWRPKTLTFPYHRISGRGVATDGR
jgi:glycosyltransferase involved in cell wall biosynthesis